MLPDPLIVSILDRYKKNLPVSSAEKAMLHSWLGNSLPRKQHLSFPSASSIPHDGKAPQRWPWKYALFAVLLIAICITLYIFGIGSAKKKQLFIQMIAYTTVISNFGQQGEKTGWIYIVVPAEIAQQIKPGTRKSYRVKGKIDAHPIKQVSLLPMGEGAFIIPLNAVIRKAIKKNIGAMVKVQLAEDTTPVKLSADLIECLKDEPQADQNFQKLAPSHQRYFSNWIDSAKTEETKSKRIARTVQAMLKNMDYGAMLREDKQRR